MHFVWSTWDRLPLITPPLERRLYGGMINKCRDLKWLPIRMGGIADHVHLLVRMHPSVAISTFVKEAKGSSSHLITHDVAPGEFKWQGGYGAFTLCAGDVSIVKAWIADQKNHHQYGTMQMEWEKCEIADEADLALEDLTEKEILEALDV